MRKQTKGFTLLELMIGVAIVGVLLAIAVPRYERNVTRGNRAAAQAEMLQIAALVERWKAQQLTYNGASLSTLYGSSQSPKTGTANYNLTLNVTNSGTVWTLSAVPVNRQLAKQDGVMAIDSLGRRCWNPGIQTGVCDLTNASLAWNVVR